MSIINNGLLLASGADTATTYQVSRSLRFNASDSAYLSRTPASAGNRKTWTWSGWVKRSTLSSGYQTLFSGGSGGGRLLFGFDSGNAFSFELQGTGSHATTAVFRDPSAWYHVVVAFDTTQATAADRTKVWINNTLQTLSGLTFSQNTDYAINSNVEHRIGCQTSSVADFFNGYLADIYFLDGTATTPSTFAETDAVTGQWVPKTPTGISYGTNGFRLSFSDNSGTTSTTLGKDAAGSNNWSPSNFSVASGSGNDSLVDSPTSYGTDTGAGGEVRGNYATLNPLNSRNQTTLANGNLDAGPNSTNNGTAHAAFSTIGVDSGKWYCEATVISGGSSSNIMVGISDITQLAGNVFDFYSRGYGYRNDALKINNNSGSSYGATYTNNDVIGIALDLTAGTLVFYKNGSSQGTAFSGISSSYVYHFACFVRNTDDKVAWNFGQRPFAYTAPSGFKALCDTNLPAPVVAKPNTAMDVVTYTGTGSNRSISTLQFNPDLVWMKGRNAATQHVLQNVISGTNKILNSASTDAELTDTTGIQSFDANGFSLGTGGAVNANGSTYVAWAWDAGTSTVTNTQGSITSSVRANASAGFSIVSWSANNTANQSIGHGLGVTPAFIIHKNRTTTGNWNCWFTGFSNDEYINLNGTGAKANTGGGLWYQTPTSSLFYIGFTGSAINNSTDAIISYCFAPVAGYSSFGSYTGNGSADGTFIYTGFRPRFILMKDTTVAHNWQMLDSARDSYNVASNRLFPNTNGSEVGSSVCFDFLSNGFKARDQYTTSESGSTYIYFAVAESPFQYARAR